jgi:hypothetical protein
LPLSLANWLQHVNLVFQAIHPAAIDILGLRLEGHEDREIAERVGLGLRLVRRILQDMRLAWEPQTREA